MDTSDSAVNAKKEPASLQQPALDVGLTLREARERLGMSVHDVAERIKFAPRQVEALEANDFTHLPEAAFLRGFVRSYARVLHLDEATLISALPSGSSGQVAAKAQSVNAAFPNMQSLRRNNVLLFAGALGVALVLGLFVLFHEGEPASKRAQVVVEPVTLPTAEVAVSAVVETGSQAGTPEVAPVVEPDKATGNTATKADDHKAGEKPGSGQPVVKPAPRIEAVAPAPAPIPTVKQPQSPTAKPTVVQPQSPTTKPTVVQPQSPAAKPTVVQPLPRIDAASAVEATAAKPPIPLEVLKRRPLHLVFVESAWAEVIDAHGVVLLSRNNQRGTEKWVGGPRHEPYEISIAHPANVRLFFRGKEIDLSAYAGMDVAHLRVE